MDNKFSFQRKGGFVLGSNGLTIAQLPKPRIDLSREPCPYAEAEKERKGATVQ